MKIAVAATGGSLDAQVSEQFGRCACFIIVDSETMKFEPVSNPAGQMSGGAGPAAVNEISRRNAEIAVAGRFGPKAEDAMKMAGIRYQTAGGTVREAVEALQKS